MHLRLPRKLPCLELEDVRDAHQKCASKAGLKPVPTRLSCSRSVEKLCVERARVLDAKCQAQGTGKAVMAEASMEWESVVFGMALHDSADEARVVQAAADTWLQMARGADLVLMTDADDPRNASAIAPRLRGGSGGGGGSSTVHVFRCAECRGRPCTKGSGGSCTGVREGWLARRKVLHLFTAMARLYSVVAGGSGGGGSGWRRYFLKLDPDTVPVPHNMIRLLGELHATLGAAQPYLFGMAACRVKDFPLCHASGGAGYGLSRGGLLELMKFVKSSYPSYLTRVDKFTYGGEDITVAFALKKQSSVSVVNVGCMYQHDPLKYRRLHNKGEDWVRWPLSTTPVSFHKFKDADELRAFYSCALYHRSGTPRQAPRALFALANGVNASGGNGGACGEEEEVVTTIAEADGDASLLLPQQQQQHVNRKSRYAVVKDGGVIQINS